MLCYGASKSGKTFAYCNLIDEVLKKDPTVNFFVLNTDNGFKRTFEGYFAMRGIPAPNANVKSVYTPDPTVGKIMMDKVSMMAKPKDFVVVDLISDYYGMAKGIFFEESAKVAGVTLDQYIAKIAKTKVGGLDPSSWALVTQLNNAVAYDPLAHPYCNVFACATEKSINVAEQYASREKDPDLKKKKEDYLSTFEEAGAMPGGHHELPFKFNTILHLNGRRPENRAFTIVADRGAAIDESEGHPYKHDMWAEFLKVRETLRPKKREEGVKTPSP